MRRVAVLLTLLLTCCHIGWSSHYLQKNIVATRPTGHPPTIDGELNDLCWQGHNCGRLTYFVLPDMSRLADPQTQALVCFDAENLYVAVRCDEPSPSKLKMGFTHRDDPVWQDDCVELFMDTNQDRTTFYQIVINSGGTVFDRGPDNNRAWDAHLKVATKISHRSWQVECAIPFADLDTVPRPGDAWGFNVGRERKVAEQLSVWSPTYGGFPQPSRFGELLFTNLAATPVCEVQHEPMFGLNEIAVSGPTGTAPRARIVRSWPTTTPPPWPYPEPRITPVQSSSDYADEAGVANYRVHYRIVDGSEKCILIAQVFRDETVLRQAIPVNIQPAPPIVELLTQRLPVLKQYGERDTTFEAQIRKLISGTRQHINQIVRSNLARDDRMPQQQWEQAAQQLSRAADLSYIVWTKSPWKNLERQEMPPSLDGDPIITLEACGNEYESANFIITNLSDSTLEGHLEIEDLHLSQSGDATGHDFSPRCIQFRDVVFHKLRSGQTVADPLPEMGQAKIISVPSGESRQVWLTLNAENLPPGEYTTTITFLPFQPQLPTKAIPVSIRIRPVRLPEQMPILTYNWDYFSGDYSEQYVRNLAEHRTNCFSMRSRHNCPIYDADGNVIEKFDWNQREDPVLYTKLHYARKHGGLIVYSYGVAWDFYKYSQRYGWEFMSEPYQRAFGWYLRELERHLREDIGMKHNEYVVQIWDEAHHHGHGELAVRSAEFMRSVVPQMRTCMDGGPPTEGLADVNPLVDIWIPHMSRLWGDEKVHDLTAFKGLGKPVCTYTTDHPKKALDPHDYFRLQPWRVWKMGLNGSFYWGLFSTGTDLWNDFDGSKEANCVMYTSPEGPVTSRRWEATREGREDYIYLYMLRESARQSGDDREQQIEHYLSDLVDRALTTSHDPQVFRSLRHELGDVLETQITRQVPILLGDPEFKADSSGIRCNWKTDRPTSGRLLYRVPGFQQWRRVDFEQETKHSARIDAVPAHRPVQWYLVYWTKSGATAACLKGLCSEYWFRSDQ